ncbi:hypothetical protein [Streptomyces sp. NPDC046988]|uniref:hypothetical protein n=1 Tax=Streptomyces sp. NPDC046988 TaxID=3154922 RepID=UPI0033F05955
MSAPPADPDPVRVPHHRRRGHHPAASAGRRLRSRPGGNQITDTALGIALRYGPDSRWYPFGASEGDWECLAAPRDAAAAAYRAALAAKRSRARASSLRS